MAPKTRKENDGPRKNSKALALKEMTRNQLLHLIYLIMEAANDYLAKFK